MGLIIYNTVSFSFGEDCSEGKESMGMLFSVVIPVYNREKTIQRAIKSVLAQTYSNFELIIIDDGSSDRTREIVESYSSDNRIRYYFQNNSGAQKARNNGLKKSKGNLILFLDSDDELLPDCLKEMECAFAEDAQLGAVYCLTGIKDSNGNIRKARNDTLSGSIYKEVLKQGYLTSSSFISMRSNIFEIIGNWDESFQASQDDDICFRISKHYKIGLVDKILGLYWSDAGEGKQISSSQSRVANGWWMLWKKYEAEVISECGKNVLVDHICECAYRFLMYGDEQYKDCMGRVRLLSNSFVYCERYCILFSRVFWSKTKRVLCQCIRH